MLVLLSATGMRAAQTQQSGLTQDYEKCMEVAATNFDMSQCSTKEVERQEQRLTEAWKKVFAVMKETSPTGQALLLKEQRAWIAYKDAACAFYGASEFGREGTVVHLGACRAEIIAARVSALTELQKFLE
jgi:uncharacterized protein YecT (DUF1311 family)